MEELLFQYIILGIIQGVTEWLPISSEGLLVIAMSGLFQSSEGVLDLVQTAIFLHMGTLLAAVVYLRKDVKHLVISMIGYRSADKKTRLQINFLIVSFIISGFVGLVLLEVLASLEGLVIAGRGIMFAVGLLLLITAGIQLRASREGFKGSSGLRKRDSVDLGIAQGLAILPGLSRSGLTVSALLLKGFGKKESLRLSFLMSLPAVLAGNIALNIDVSMISTEMLAGLSFSFLFGLLTIGGLFRLAKRIDFGYFVLGFAILTLFAAILIG
jgi:undecaprenyl-diphosphatase